MKPDASTRKDDIGDVPLHTRPVLRKATEWNLASGMNPAANLAPPTALHAFPLNAKSTSRTTAKRRGHKRASAGPRVLVPAPPPMELIDAYKARIKQAKDTSPVWRRRIELAKSARKPVLSTSALIALRAKADSLKRSHQLSHRSTTSEASPQSKTSPSIAFRTPQTPTSKSRGVTLALSPPRPQNARVGIADAGEETQVNELPKKHLVKRPIRKIAPTAEREKASQVQDQSVQTSMSKLQDPSESRIDTGGRGELRSSLPSTQGSGQQPKTSGFTFLQPRSATSKQKIFGPGVVAVKSVTESARTAAGAPSRIQEPALSDDEFMFPAAASTFAAVTDWWTAAFQTAGKAGSNLAWSGGSPERTLSVKKQTSVLVHSASTPPAHQRGPLQQSGKKFITKISSRQPPAASELQRMPSGITRGRAEQEQMDSNGKQLRIQPLVDMPAPIKAASGSEYSSATEENSLENYSPIATSQKATFSAQPAVKAAPTLEVSSGKEQDEQHALNSKLPELDAGSQLAAESCSTPPTLIDPSTQAAGLAMPEKTAEHFGLVLHDRKQLDGTKLPIVPFPHKETDSKELNRGRSIPDEATARSQRQLILVRQAIANQKIADVNIDQILPGAGAGILAG